MFFGKGDTLEGYLRKRDAEGFKTWDGHAMRVHVVKTKAQKQNEMICVLLVNEGDILHRAYVVTPNSDTLMKGGVDLWTKFQVEYLPSIHIDLSE